MNVLGIDFGMENLKVSYHNGRTTKIINLSSTQGNKITPNIVYYEEDVADGLLKKYFGKSTQAETAKVTNPNDYIRHIKQKLQYKNWKKAVCNGKYTFSSKEIVEDIFENIKTQVDLNIRHSNYSTVITVPVLFSEMQKNKLCECAEKVGFDVQEIITEPFASLFSEEILEECMEDCDDGKYVIIFDFGGSTLDICLIKITGEDESYTISLRTSAGLKYGGVNITESIKKNIIDVKYADLPEKLRADGYIDEKIEYMLYNAAEDLKQDLFEDDDTEQSETRLSGNSIHLDKSEFEQMLRDEKIDTAINSLFDTLLDEDDEGVEKSDISEIYAIGGSSRITFFQDIIRNYFGKDIQNDLSEDAVDVIYNSVALGASNYLQQKENVNIEVSVPIAVGIDRGKGFEEMIRKNAFYSENHPRITLTPDFLNTSDWKIPVYQRISNDVKNRSCEDIVYIGKFVLTKKLYKPDEKAFVMISQNANGIQAELSRQNDEHKYENVETLYLKMEE